MKVRQYQTSCITGLTMSSPDSTPTLRQRRQALIKQLGRLEPFILRGSLIERFKPCGKPGCKCAQGPGHGPKILFVGQPARRPPRDGLRPGGALSTSLRVPPQLPASASAPRTDLQPQSRVITASGEVLTLNEHGAFGTTPPRSRYGRDARRQLSAKLVASRRGPRTPRCREPS
jgi:Family of unknown function (DUF6788)